MDKKGFRKIALLHGIMAPDSVLDAVFTDTIKELKKGSAPINEFIAAYCDAWKGRYGTHPKVMGKDAGAAKAIVKALGVAEACSLVEVYLKMNDSFFLTRRHALDTFQSNINAVVQKRDTNTQITRKQAQSAESTQGSISAAQSYLEKKRGKLGTADDNTKP